MNSDPVTESPASEPVPHLVWTSPKGDGYHTAEAVNCGKYPFSLLQGLDISWSYNSLYIFGWDGSASVSVPCDPIGITEPPPVQFVLAVASAAADAYQKGKSVGKDEKDAEIKHALRTLRNLLP